MMDIESYTLIKLRKDDHMDLKTIRREKSMTQLQLAELSGCDRTMIGKIETGEVKPSVKLAKTIAGVLGFDWTLFYEDVEGNKRGA